MFKQTVIILILAWTVAFTGCSSVNVDNTWPQPSTLGENIPAYTPPVEVDLIKSLPVEKDGPIGELTLQQALELALNNSPHLAATAWAVRSAEARAFQAGLPPNPKFQAEIEEFGGSDELRSFDAAEYTLILGQSIELGGKRKKRAHVAALERNLAGWDYESRRLDLLRDVRQAFTDVLAAQEGLSLTEDLFILAEELLQTVEKRVEAGAASSVEKMKAEIELFSLRIELEQQKRNLGAARKRLAALWGSTSTPFTLAVGDMELLSSVPSEKKLVDHIASNPDIARSLVELEQREAALKLEQASRMPDVTLIGGLKWLNGIDDQAFVAGVDVPLPLYDRNQGGIREAQYEVAKAREMSRATKLTLESSLVSAHQQLLNAYRGALTLKNELLPRARESFEKTNEGYQQGRFRYLDVLDAQRTLFEAKGQYIETLANYHKAVALIESLLGTPLGLILNKEEM